MLYLPSTSRTLNYGQLVNRACPLNRGLVAWWLNLPARGKGNTFFDIAGNAHGTLTNGPTWQGARGRPGGWGAVNFDGTNDYVDATSAALLASLASASVWTVSFWAWASSYTADPCALAIRTGAGTAGTVIIYPYDSFGGNGFRTHWNSADRINIDSGAPGVGWNHFTLTNRSSTDHELYVNGISVATSATALSLGASIDAVNIGTWRPSVQPYVGAMDDIRLSLVGLTASDAWNLYNDSRQGYPLTLNWTRPRVAVAGGGGGSPVNVTPTTTNLTLTTFAPTVSTPRLCTPTTAPLTTTKFAPTVSTPRLCTPTTASLTVTTFAPTVSTPVVVVVPPATFGGGGGSIGITTYAPTVSTPRLCTPAPASLVLTAYAPDIGGSITAVPATATLTITTFAPSIVLDTRVVPSTVAIVCSGFAPTVLTPRVCTPQLLACVLTAYAPTVTGNANDYSRGALTINNRTQSLIIDNRTQSLIINNRTQSLTVSTET